MWRKSKRLFESVKILALTSVFIFTQAFPSLGTLFNGKAAQAAEKVIYNQNFDDGKVDGWRQSGGNGKATFTAANGAMKVEATPVSFFVNDNSPAIADGECEFKVKMEKGIDRWGFLFRYQDPLTCEAIYSDKDGNWLHGSWENGRETGWPVLGNKLLEAGKQYTIKVRYVGNDVELYVDGENIFKTKIDAKTTKPGKIGFRTWYDNKVMYFDDFKLTEIAEDPLPPADAVNKTNTIESDKLKVTVDEKFPSIVKYTWKANGAVMYGQEDQLSKILINGTEYTPEVSFTKTADKANYILNIPSINVQITAQVKVADNNVEFDITKIEEKGDTKVSTIEIPNHNILSVRNNQEGANLAATRMYNKVDGSGDTFLKLTGTPTVNPSPVGYMYGFLNTNQLSAGIWTNSVYDKPSGKTARENYRIQKQTVNKGDYFRTGLWSGAWTYRASDMTATEALPSEKISITDDINNDGIVDWQDGAIAFRNVMNNPQGAERVPQVVVQRIAMNFGSQATNPFLKTLDETKKVYLATDGLGQATILKGYGSEGHDSGHPDYGHIGERIGGVKDMNTLITSGAKYNADFGVHVNATESYPEAKAFSETLIDPKKPGWDWLDASFYIKTHDDATSGNRLERFKQLKAQVPELKFIYLDVWYGDGWESRKIASEINSQGWRLETEFPNTLEAETTFSHWATDYKYGGRDMKGFNSQIVRFLRNHQKDTWIARNPLLGGTELCDFEGWQGRVDFNNMIKMTFGTNLPTKYMQNFPIIKWTDDTISFENNVTVSNSTGTRIIKKDGITILDGDSYLLPWEPNTETKLYHWNAKGGKTTWTLPISWQNLNTVKLYKLTDTGKQLIEDLKVTNNQITINADENTPYVVYKGEAAKVNVNWGEGSLVKDPGFESGKLDNWVVTGTGASVERNDRGQYELKFGESNGATVSQKITGLTAGTYTASVNVQIDGKRRATIGVKDSNGTEVSNYADSSLAKNYISADSKNNTNMQRMRVFFDVPKGQTTATLYLKVDKGSDIVAFDDVRVTKAVRSANPTNAYFTQDFENVPEGLYPFVKGPAGGINDPRTHLSELHAPYTQKGWNGNAIDDVISGNWSLKAHKEAGGLLLQTIPQTLRFEAGKNYKVTFKYETPESGDYGFVIGDGTKEIYKTGFEAATEPKTYSISFTASTSGESWIGIRKLTGGATDFVLDDLIVDDLGSGETIQLPPSNLSGDPSLIPQDEMKATATSEEKDYEPASNAIDGDSSTLWNTKWDGSDKLPQSLTIDLGQEYKINKVVVTPRQDASNNGRITKYELYISNNGVDYNKVSEGTWDTTKAKKTILFDAVQATHVKLIVLEAGNGFASVAEINVGRYLRNTEAITSLIEKANEVLKSAVVGEAEGQYPQSAKDILEKAIKDAQVLLDNEKSTQADLDSAVEALNTAIKEFKEKVVHVDLEALNNEIAKANQVLKSAVVGEAEGQYLQSAKNALEAVINAAQKVLADKEASQKAIDNAVTTLKKAVSEFENKKNGPKAPDTKPEDSNVQKPEDNDVQKPEDNNVQKPVDSNTKPNVNKDKREQIIDISKNPIVSKNVFNDIKGMDKKLIFAGKNVTWTFNGKDIKSSVKTNIDLSLKEVSESLRSKEIAKVKSVLGKEVPVASFSFNYDGALPGTAVVKVFVGKEWSNKEVYICRYYSDKNNYEIVGENKVDAGGYVEYKTNHCSDYFVVEKNEKINLPKTGSLISANTMLGLGVLLISLGAFAITFQRKKNSKNNA